MSSDNEITIVGLFGVGVGKGPTCTTNTTRLFVAICTRVGNISDIKTVQA